MKEEKEVEEKKEKKKIDWKAGVEKFKKEKEKEEQVEEEKWKRVDNREDIGKGMNEFWNAVEEKKKPKVETTMPRIPAVGKESRFWKK